MSRLGIRLHLARGRMSSGGPPPVAISDFAFSFNLLRQLAQDRPATNISISPYSAA
jgi:hypothetical protein